MNGLEEMKSEFAEGRKKRNSELGEAINRARYYQYFYDPVLLRYIESQSLPDKEDAKDAKENNQNNQNSETKEIKDDIKEIKRNQRRWNPNYIKYLILKTESYFMLNPTYHFKVQSLTHAKNLSERYTKEYTLADLPAWKEETPTKSFNEEGEIEEEEEIELKLFEQKVTILDE